jgi:hypothetical protein
LPGPFANFLEIYPARSGVETVRTIMTAPNAFISGLIEFLNIPNILTGTVWFWAVAQKRVAVTSSKEMVNAKSIPAKIAGANNGNVISLNV